jgi:hypothetical protein
MIACGEGAVYLRPAKAAVICECGRSVPESEKGALRWMSMEEDM